MNTDVNDALTLILNKTLKYTDSDKKPYKMCDNNESLM